ncbi:MAG: hypothetical protein K2M63_09640 [Muribaculaceae bacterium]|nr:hypothetical protein [Muribaculaceae bacterium]
MLIDKNLKLTELIDLHARRFTYEHDTNQLLKSLSDFSKADDEPDPICNLGKFWDMIKLDLLDELEKFKTE